MIYIFVRDINYPCLSENFLKQYYKGFFCFIKLISDTVFRSNLSVLIAIKNLMINRISHLIATF